MNVDMEGLLLLLDTQVSDILFVLCGDAGSPADMPSILLTTGAVDIRTCPPADSTALEGLMRALHRKHHCLTAHSTAEYTDLLSQVGMLSRQEMHFTLLSCRALVGKFPLCLSFLPVEFDSARRLLT